jgi:hypothetical protein
MGPGFPDAVVSTNLTASARREARASLARPSPRSEPRGPHAMRATPGGRPRAQGVPARCQRAATAPAGRAAVPATHAARAVRVGGGGTAPARAAVPALPPAPEPARPLAPGQHAAPPPASAFDLLGAAGATRRGVLRSAALLGASMAACPCCAPPPARASGGAVFSYGAMSGGAGAGLGRGAGMGRGGGAGPWRVAGDPCLDAAPIERLPRGPARLDPCTPHPAPPTPPRPNVVGRRLRRGPPAEPHRHPREANLRVGAPRGRRRRGVPRGAARARVLRGAADHPQHWRRHDAGACAWGGGGRRRTGARAGAGQRLPRGTSVAWGAAPQAVAHPDAPPPAAPKVNYPKGSQMLTCGGADLELLQFHFHTPSEHRRAAAARLPAGAGGFDAGRAPRRDERVPGIRAWTPRTDTPHTHSHTKQTPSHCHHARSFDGERAAMEVHLVHRNLATGGLSVVGVLLEVGGAPNQALSTALRHAPAGAREEVMCPDAINPALLLPRGGSWEVRARGAGGQAAGGRAAGLQDSAPEARPAPGGQSPTHPPTHSPAHPPIPPRPPVRALCWLPHHPRVRRGRRLVRAAGDRDHHAGAGDGAGGGGVAAAAALPRGCP